MHWKPKNSIAIVTGASSGIGSSLSQLLCQAGCHVVAVARRAERLEELAGTVPNGSLSTVVGDITQPETRSRVLDVATTQGDGRLDLLINNAGIGAIGPFSDASPERLRQIMEVNFFAPVELTRICIPALRLGRSPVICNISSVLGHRAVPNKSEYCASKFAIHGFSDSLRAELACDGIQVTLVSPSTTRSEFFDSLIDTASDSSSKSLGSWSPQKVARSTIAAIRWRRSEVVLSLGGKALVYADRLSPPLLNAILAKSEA
ncbi:SDR family NAD(P)-dependent oxidoreductase [Rubripirellula amarantea]|nr:SDR family NAD(P)-dependent oxidoreductase [Rubripirellula amarantea]